MPSFELTAQQKVAEGLLWGEATHIMLRGGSRSGKTLLACRCIVSRALLAPGSRHAILRFRFNAVKSSIVLDTWPKMMALCFPGVTYTLDKTAWYCEFPNRSQVWFGGLDDKDRVDKILGNEYATILLNECSQISWASRNIALTRLAQRCEVTTKRDGQSVTVTLTPRMLYDQNPPPRSHWTYLVFERGLDPESKTPLPDRHRYVSVQMNPRDNVANLPEGYLATLEGMSARFQRRFLLGEYGDDAPGQLFPEVYLDRWRVTDATLPQMVRLVVAVDPSGAGEGDAPEHDAIGIAVCGLGADGVGYLLEDLTIKAGPATWGAVVASAFERHQADLVVGEANFGGDMVRYVVQTARPRTPYKAVSASRGKVVRADPISALVETGKVRLVGYFAELEEELAGFTQSGYVGTGSPGRVDALVWGMTELFSGIVAGRKERPAPKPRAYRHDLGGGAWMGG